MIVVMITAVEGREPEPVGPFPNGEWARKYVERMSKNGYHKLEIKLMLSPILIGVAKSLDPKDDRLSVVFDPAEGIDR